MKERSPAAPCLHLPALAVQGGAGTSGLVRQDSLAAALCEHKQAGSSHLLRMHKQPLGRLPIWTGDYKEMR